MVKRKIMEGIILNEKYQFKKKLNSEIIEEKKYVFNDFILYYISLILEIKIEQEEIRDKILIFMNMILKLYFLGYNDINLDFNNYIDIIIDKER